MQSGSVVPFHAATPVLCDGTSSRIVSCHHHTVRLDDMTQHGARRDETRQYRQNTPLCAPLRGDKMAPYCIAHVVVSRSSHLVSSHLMCCAIRPCGVFVWAHAMCGVVICCLVSLRLVSHHAVVRAAVVVCCGLPLWGVLCGGVGVLPHGVTWCDHMLFRLVPCVICEVVLSCLIPYRIVSYPT